jgi:hypothetical protein
MHTKVAQIYQIPGYTKGQDGNSKDGQSPYNAEHKDQPARHFKRRVCLGVLFHKKIIFWL